MTDPTITPEQVLAAGVRRRETAERIAIYANRRAAGDRPIDAGRGFDVDRSTLSNWDRWANAVRRGLGLPDLPKGRLLPFESRERMARAGVSGQHASQHVARGVTNPDCPLCTPPKED